MVNKIVACNTALGYDCNVNNEQLKDWLPYFPEVLNFNNVRRHVIFEQKYRILK